MNLISESEINALLQRREELYQKLNDKIKYEQEMENVRKNPSRAESTQYVRIYSTNSRLSPSSEPFL
jgi:arsenate reductase-like glutaredoxin family protein